MVRARSGISLVEVMVAVVVLGVGLLSLAAANAAFARYARGAAWEARAATLAHRRIEWLAASCAATSGSATTPGAVERWSSRRVAAIVHVDVGISAPPSAAPRTRPFQARLWCADR